MRRPSLKYPPLARKRGQNPRNQVNLVNKQVHPKLAQKICEVSLCIRLTIYDLVRILSIAGFFCSFARMGILISD